MKTLLAISPKLPQSLDLAPFSHCLDFLKPNYQITFVDSLEKFKNLSYQEYTTYWQQKINTLMADYDVFMGFSLGGVLLLNSLAQFYNKNKTIILCSVPGQLDPLLKDKLHTVLNASLSGQSKEAIQLLHQYVFEENQPEDFENKRKEPWAEIASRLQYGLGYVLNHTFDASVIQSKTPVYQLVGERSNLVTKDNILNTPNSILQIVPNAGNRVLEDNPLFSQAIIKGWLHV